MSRSLVVVAVLIVSSAIISCGSEELGATNEYYPLAVGHSWEYFEEFEDSTTNVLRYEITGMETINFDHGVGEKEVYVLRNTFPESEDTEYKIQYLHDDGGRIDRLRHLIYRDVDDLKSQRDFAPGFLRFDRDKIDLGDTFSETVEKYDTVLGNSTDDYAWEITSVTEDVVLMDGTVLNNCIKMERANVSKGELKIYYFAVGIGKVKEETTGGLENKTELLMEVPAFARSQ